MAEAPAAVVRGSPSIEQLVRNDLAFVIAQAIDTAALIGDGASNNPTGITQTSGITSVTFGGTPTWGKILEFSTELMTDHALMGSLGWIAEPKAVKTMRSTEKVAGHPEYIMNGVNELAGYPLLQTTTLPNVGNESTIVFGNWSDLLIGYWSAVDILVNPYHSDVYSKGGVKINALQDCDIAVRHPESFVVATDLATT